MINWNGLHGPLTQLESQSDMSGFRCRSSSKILGLSVFGECPGANVESKCRVSELARLKLEYHNYETARRNSKQLASNDFSFDKERYDKNRKRRLMKEKNEKEKKEEENQTTKLEDKCRKCQQDISPPFHVYICQNGHLHKERQGGQNFQVS